MNLSQPNVVSEASLYRRRHTRASFTEQLKDEEEMPELSAEEILNINRVRTATATERLRNLSPAG